MFCACFYLPVTVLLHTVLLAIDMILSSLCPSVMLCIIVLRVDVGGLTLCHCVPKTAFLVHFCRNICCRRYYLATKHSECQHSAKEQATQQSDNMLTGIKSRLLFETVNKLS